MSLCVFMWFQVFSGWNWGTWAKIWSRGWKGLQMLLDSDLATLEVNFLEPHKPNWRALNCVGKYTSWAFQQCIIVHTLPKIWWPKPAFKVSLRILAFNARTGIKTGVKRPNWHKSWRLIPRKVSTHESFNAQPKHTPSGPRKWNFTLTTLAYSFSVTLCH